MAFGPEMPSRALPDFLRRHPALDIALGLTNRHADLIEEPIDVAIRVNAQPDSGLIARKAFTLRIILVASPEYRAASGTPRSFEDLAANRAVTQRSGSWGILRARLDGAPVAFEMPSHLALNAPAATWKALLTGYGYGLAGDFVVARGIAMGASSGFCPRRRRSTPSIPTGPMLSHRCAASSTFSLGAFLQVA